MSRGAHPVAALAAGLLLAGCSSGPPANVVLIAIDTLRADRLGSYGHDRPTSPNIDRLASEAIRYERAIAQAPWTTPSLASLLSSRYPSSLGIERSASPLPPDVPLLQEVLRDAGYVTGGVVSHSFCSSRWGFARGFDSFDESNIRGQRAVTSAAVTDRALEFVDGRGERPFFLFVHYFDPHFALVEHEGFAFAREGDYVGPVRSPVPFLVFGRADAGVGADDAREMLRIYDSEVAFTDHHVGRLLDGLRERGLYESSLVVLTADHGEEFLEHGRIGHTKTLYQELLHVPLLIKRPGRAAGSTVSRAVGLIDVFPSVLEVLGLDAPEGLRGRSLLDPDAPSRPIYSETARQAYLRAVVDEPLKLIVGYDGRWRELYDLSADPGETHNLARERAADAGRIVRLLMGWNSRNERHAPAPAPVVLTDEERERLHSLGYGE